MQPAQAWDRGPAIAAAVALSVISIAPFLVLPLFVEGISADMHYSARQVGVVTSLIGVGTVLSALTAGVWVRRVPWPLAAGVLLVFLAGANGASVLFHSALPFLAAQCVAGFSGGALYSLTLTVLSDSRNPNRSFGLAVTAQVAFQVIGLLCGPAILRELGVDGLLLTFVALSLLGLAAIRLLPSTVVRPESDGEGKRILTPPMMLALAGCFFFFFQIGVFWTYVGVIGRAAGHDAQAIAACLAFGVTLGLPGALLAAWWGERSGLALPMALSTVFVLLAMVLAHGAAVLAMLAASVLTYNFAWNLSMPYQYSLVNALDRSGRSVAVVPAFAAAGFAAGPAVESLLVSPDDYSSVLWLTATAVLASFACFRMAIAGSRGGASD